MNANAQSEPDGQIAQLKGAGATEVLADVGSGVSRDRAGFNCLMTLIATDQVDTVLVTRLDRLSRSTTQLSQFISLCRDKDVAISVLDQPFLCPDQNATVTLLEQFFSLLQSE